MMHIDLTEQIRDRILSELTGGEDKVGHTPVAFSMRVELTAREENLTLLEALAILVESYDLEPEQIPKMLTVGFKQKLAMENGIVKYGKALEM